MAARVAALACRRLSRRLLSSSSAAASPTLLGYFHQPRSIACLGDLWSPTPRPARTAPCFEPLAASFSLFDSHRGLLLLLQRDEIRLLVCDPVSRRHAVLPPPPPSFVAEASQFLATALVSRRGSFEFDAVCFTALDVGHLSAWVASFRNGECRWRALPQAAKVALDFHPFWFEQRCVHAAGSLYWHVCNHDSALALDAATLEFSFARAPRLIWPEEDTFAKFRFGERPYDGRLCVGALEWERLCLCVRGTGSRDGWVLDREMCLRQVLYSVPSLPEDTMGRTSCIWLADIDPGRTGKVFIGTNKYGYFAYHMETGALNRLTTDDGQEYGRKIFAYFSAPDGGSGY